MPDGASDCACSACSGASDSTSSSAGTGSSIAAAGSASASSSGSRSDSDSGSGSGSGSGAIAATGAIAAIAADTTSTSIARTGSDTGPTITSGAASTTAGSTTAGSAVTAAAAGASITLGGFAHPALRSRRTGAPPSCRASSADAASTLISASGADAVSSSASSSASTSPGPAASTRARAIARATSTSSSRPGTAIAIIAPLASCARASTSLTRGRARRAGSGASGGTTSPAAARFATPIVPLPRRGAVNSDSPGAGTIGSVGISRAVVCVSRTLVCSTSARRAASTSSGIGRLISGRPSWRRRSSIFKMTSRPSRVTRCSSIAMPNAAFTFAGSGSRAARTVPSPTSTGVSFARRSSNLISVPIGWIDFVGKNRPDLPTFAANFSTSASTSS